MNETMRKAGSGGKSGAPASPCGIEGACGADGPCGIAGARGADGPCGIEGAGRAEAAREAAGRERSGLPGDAPADTGGASRGAGPAAREAACKHPFPTAFRALLCAQAVSLFGNAVLRFALPLYVLNLTGSSALMGVAIACAWIPYVVLTPLGGVAADRVRKRLIMAALDGAMAAVCVLYLALSGTLDIVVLSMAALAALYAAQSVYQPTVQAAVPGLVGRHGVQRATAAVSQVSMLSSLVGPVLGGLLFGFFGMGPVVAASGVLFAASAVLTAVSVRVPFTPLPRSEGMLRTVAHDLSDAAAFVRTARPLIARVIVLAAAFNLVMSSFVIIATPVAITEVLGLANQYMGFAEGALALGGLVGALAAGTFSARLDLHRSPAVLAAGAVSLAPLALCAAPVPAMAAYAAAVAGLFCCMACCTVFSIAAVSFVQAETPAHLVGKVMALAVGLGNCASPVGQLAYGWLLDAFRGSLPGIVAGVVAASCLIAWAVVRAVKRDGAASGRA